MPKHNSGMFNNHSTSSLKLKSFLLIMVCLLTGVISYRSFGQTIAKADIPGSLTKGSESTVTIPTYTITLSDSVNQPITGWGCFPGFVDWGARIGFNKSLQNAIYGDLGMTVVRVKIYPDLSSFGPDPMDMLAFISNSKTIVLLTNPTAIARNLTMKGLTGTKAEPFRTSGSEDMANVGSQAIVKGESTVLLPANSVLIVETNGGR
jgi:hypothetical protein